MLRFALMAGAILALATGALAADPIQWADNFEVALAQAAETDTPLMVEFVSNGCSRCTKMRTKTLTAPEVTELAAAFVAAKVNRQQRDDIATRYMIARYPTILFLAPSGEILSQFSGYLPVEPFVGVMEDALSANKALARARELEAALGEDGGTAEEWLAIAREYKTANQHKQAADYAQKTLESGVAEVRAEALLIRGKALVSMDEMRAAVEPLLQYVSEYPAAEGIWVGKFYLGYAYATTGQEDAGRPILADLAANAPKDLRERAAAENLLAWLDEQG